MFLSDKSVLEAAEIVIEPPLLKFVPLIVPRDPEINPEPIVVVETTSPFSFVARSALVTPVNHVDPVLVNAVVDARVLLKRPTTVEDACETKPLWKVPRPTRLRVDESVATPVTPSVPANDPLPPVNVPTVALFVNKFVELAVVVKKEVEVACVSVTLPVKVLVPLQVLMSESRVEEAAETVIDEPRAKLVPLIVPREPEMRPEPMVVVDTTRPF